MAESNLKNKKIIWILIAAIVFSLATGFLLYRFLSPKKATIYIFRDNYKAGQAVTDDILLPMQVDASVVLAGAQTDVSSQFVTPSNRADLLEKKANSLRIDVTKGMPLIQSMLSIDGGSYIEMNMDDKKVAVTVPVTSVSGVTTDLKAGSRVNIYATGSNSYDGENVTELIFENMRILSVTSDDGYLTSATVEVTLDESLKLINAANNYSLYFGLVNGAGYQSSGQTGLYYSPGGGSDIEENLTYEETAEDPYESDTVDLGGSREAVEGTVVSNEEGTDNTAATVNETEAAS